MDQETTNANGAVELATLMAQATQSLADALHNLDAQFASLHAKIDRITAAVDDGEVQATVEEGAGLRGRIADLEKSNADLKAQSDRARRKTLSPVVSAILAKEGVEGDTAIEAPVLEKALAGLAIEQRIAVKAELARAGILS